MSSELNFVEYICDSLHERLRQGSNETGQVSFKKMFGEYAIYYEGKLVALVCDNQLFVKPTVAGRSTIGTVVEAPPYPGAKPYFLIDERLDNPEWMLNLIQLTATDCTQCEQRSVTRINR